MSDTGTENEDYKIDEIEKVVQAELNAESNIYTGEIPAENDDLIKDFIFQPPGRKQTLISLSQSCSNILSKRRMNKQKAFQHRLHSQHLIGQ